MTTRHTPNPAAVASTPQPARHQGGCQGWNRVFLRVADGVSDGGRRGVGRNRDTTRPLFRVPINCAAPPYGANSMIEDAEVRIEYTFKNARLYHAIRDAAYRDKDHNRSFDRGRVSSFCRFYSLPPAQIHGLLNLRISPLLAIRPSGRYRAICITLSNILGIDCHVLFPHALYAQVWPRGVARDVPLAMFVGLGAARHLTLPESSSEAVVQREMRERLTGALETLTPQEALVIAQRFGLDGNGAQTLEEIGAGSGRGRERIRQIEARAMRKLRHPSRARKLWPLLWSTAPDAAKA